MKFRNTEEFTNQELEFSYGRNLYMATVSYTLETVGEYATWEYPAECETEIADFEIHSVEIYNDDQDQWFAINPDEELEAQIFEEIKKYHKL
jgi:hypothetical protein